MLLRVGGLFAVYEGIEKLRHPDEISSPAIALSILGVAVALEAFSLRTAGRAARPDKGRRSWAAYVRRSKGPELPVVLLEDVGALAGLVLAFAGVTLATAADRPRFDGAATLAIGVLLVAIAAVLVGEMKSLLIGEAAGAEQQAAIRDGIEGTPDVRRLIHMPTLHLGPDELLVAAKIELGPSLTARQIAGAVNAAEARVREAVPIARVIYLEPDLFSAEAGPAAPDWTDSPTGSPRSCGRTSRSRSSIWAIPAVRAPREGVLQALVAGALPTPAPGVGGPVAPLWLRRRSGPRG